MNKDTHAPISTAERLDALEFVLSQMLIGIEADSAAIHAKLSWLEQTLTSLAPAQLPPPTEDAIDAEPFTTEDFAQHIQVCLKHMRMHQSVSARQQVAIGQLTERLLNWPAEPDEPAIGPDAQVVLAKAQRRPPAA